MLLEKLECLSSFPVLVGKCQLIIILSLIVLNGSNKRECQKKFCDVILENWRWSIEEAAEESEVTLISV